METGAVLFALSCLTLLSCRFFRFGIINMLAADACFGLAMVFPRRVIEFLGADSPVLSFIEHEQIRPSFVAVAVYALINAVLYMACYSWRRPHRHAAAPAAAAPGTEPPSGATAAAAAAAAAAPLSAEEVPAAEQEERAAAAAPVSWTASSQESTDEPEVPAVLRGLRAIDTPAAEGDPGLEMSPAAGEAAELADKS